MDQGERPHLMPDELGGLMKRLRSTGKAATRPLSPPTAECREPSEAATLIFAPPGDPAGAAFLAHAATCDYCGPLVEAMVNPTATVHLDDEDRALVRGLETARPEWQRQTAWRFAAANRPRRSAAARWPWRLAVAVAAAVVVLVVLTGGPSQWFGPRSDRPELRDLVAALATEPARPVEGRLTGGFAYAPPPTLLRGPMDQASPRVRIAEAKLEEAARAYDTSETQAALAVGYIAVGELDRAVDALEEAVKQKPTDAPFQSDLAAAYLARAKWRDRADDWPRALAAAERAIKADPKLAEAHFNRALALEGLHLDDEAADAWTAYQAVERSPQWLQEGVDRARRLKQRSRADMPRGNQELRERIEDELLTKWGEAMIAGDTTVAAQILEEAEADAQRLVNAGGDSMARDEILLIRRVTAGQMRDSRALATGHVLYGRARHEFLSDHLETASDVMSQSADECAHVSSAYASWAPIYRAIVLWNTGSGNASLSALAKLSLIAQWRNGCWAKRRERGPISSKPSQS